MAHTTVSTLQATPVVLSTNDTLTLAPTGWVAISALGSGAIAGEGNNAILLQGFVQNTDAEGSGVQITAGGNSINVGATALVRGGNDGMRIAGTGNTIVGSGVISGLGGTGIVLVDAGGQTLNFSVGSVVQGGFDGIFAGGGDNNLINAGFVIGLGESGIRFQDPGNTLTNSGAIFGVDFGLNIAGDTGGTNTIVNTGAIRGQDVIAINSNSALVLTNSGVIDSIGGSAIQTFASTLGSTIVNNGTIASRTTVLFLSTTANDTVINNGLIVGNSFFNGGNDFYDGRNGTSIGFVFGGDGNDTLFGGAGDDDLRGGSGNDFLLGGAGADNLDGGADFDFAMYNFGGAATVVLGNNALNGGAAAGDILTSIEGVTGSEFGDTIVGDGTANQLFGLGGSDAIAGGGGADIILGGAAGDILFGEAGADTITGGAGGDVIRGGIDSDTFVFGLGDNGDLYQQLNEGGALDKFDLRGFFDATGFAGTDPRGAGIMAIFQNGADADVYLYGGFAFRIAGVAAAAIDDSYFLFQ